MPRSILFVLAALGTIGSAAAQEGEPPTVDFILRPTQAAGDEPLDDPWIWDGEPESPLLEAEIGPPLAGPAGEAPIGPPLAGPLPPLEAETPVRRLREREEDPFAPIGIRLGTFVIRPAIEIGVIATDNAAGSSDKVPAIGLVVAPEVNIRSEDERHELEADLRGEGIFYDREEFNTQTADARVRGRYDFTRLTSLRGEAGYARFLEDFTDPDTPDAAAERPGVDTFDATLGVEQRYGRFTAEVAAFAERSLHEEVPLAGGGVASREELDNMEYGGRVRTSYLMGAGLRPFGEIAAAHRDFDHEEDDSGFRRSSVWGELRGGLVIERGEKLSGEASLGYRHEDIEDDRLEDLNVFLANAAILWSPRRLTEVRFDLTTDTSTTSVPDVSGSITYAAALNVARQVTTRVRLDAGAGLAWERPVGDDWRELTFDATVGASYAFNRIASLQARYVYERVESNEPDRDSDEHEVSLRIRLQR